jgi:NAD-dependent dihydropyrimidine dehydrogenase PreA subunit
MLFHEQPSEPWNEFDFLLVEAMQVLQDETCSQCGSPIWICRNEEAHNVGFKIKKSKCFAQAELDKHKEKQDKKKSTKKAYGETEYVMPYTYDGTDFPSRQSYYESLQRADAVE